MRLIALAVLLFAMAPGAHAQVAAGNWVMRESPTTSMKVEPMGSGFDITYHLIGGDGKRVTMTLKTPLDGSETPFLINGKPTGQTYAGRKVDNRHTAGIIKMDGKPFGTTKAELSADGKTITVENETPQAGKRIEHWDKQ